MTKVDSWRWIKRSVLIILPRFAAMLISFEPNLGFGEVVLTHTGLGSRSAHADERVDVDRVGNRRDSLFHQLVGDELRLDRVACHIAFDEIREGPCMATRSNSSLNVRSPTTSRSDCWRRTCNAHALSLPELQEKRTVFLRLVNVVLMLVIGVLSHGSRIGSCMTLWTY
jgi:hypothetical protein